MQVKDIYVTLIFDYILITNSKQDYVNLWRLLKFLHPSGGSLLYGTNSDPLNSRIRTTARFALGFDKTTEDDVLDRILNLPFRFTNRTKDATSSMSAFSSR